jgi:hypothetical protein
LVTVDGKVYTAGDVNSEVSIQSISKVFTMAKVIEESGPQSIAENVGVDATGQVFNSIVAVEQFRGAEMKRQCEGSCNHGGHPRERRQESHDWPAGSAIGGRSGSVGGDGHRRLLR